MQGFVDYVRTEMLTRMQHQQEPGAGLVPMRRTVVMPLKVASVKAGRKK
jgi:MerR family transcriptional regulator/heat shock protein HspR